MDTLTTNIFAEFHSVVSKNNFEWIYIMFAICIILSIVTTWVLTNYKSKIEINKLKSENEKLIQESKKLALEGKKIESETKKIDLEAAGLGFVNQKTRYENNILKIGEKEKLINLAKDVVQANDEYNSSVSEFIDMLGALQRNKKSADQINIEIDKLTSLFYFKVVNSFNNYFSVWKALYSLEDTEIEDFFNVRLKPFLILSSSMLNKVRKLTKNNSLNDTILSIEVFDPVITYAKNNGASQHLQESIKKLEMCFIENAANTA